MQLRRSFNSRPHKEVDRDKVRETHGETTFNSRPHKEVDIINLCPPSSTGIFQLTTSQGGRPHQRYSCHCSSDLSTHDLTRRSTSGTTLPQKHLLSFNSRPHKEVDPDKTSDGDVFPPFNSRPHKEVDYPHFPSCYSLCIFQLTTSQGGRRKYLYFESDNVTIFQLTTSQGGRRNQCGSRSYKYILSTHDLTRRSTRRQDVIDYVVNLSTHDLTRRSTLNSSSMYLDSFFQLTTSQGGRLCTSSVGFTRRAFQLTTSQGGRLSSSRIYHLPSIFQLTTSQGGRRW